MHTYTHTHTHPHTHTHTHTHYIHTRTQHTHTRTQHTHAHSRTQATIVVFAANEVMLLILAWAVLGTPKLNRSYTTTPTLLLN